MVLLAKQRKVIRMIDYIEKAKAFAMMAHKDQTDKAGEDYFTAHVAQTALSLTRW